MQACNDLSCQVTRVFHDNLHTRLDFLLWAHIAMAALTGKLCRASFADLPRKGVDVVFGRLFSRSPVLGKIQMETPGQVRNSARLKNILSLWQLEAYPAQGLGIHECSCEID